MALKKDHAIVVRSFPLAEVDRIITFCTHQFGKVRAVASGSRRSTSRMAASLELFNIGLLVYFEKPNRDLHRVNSFDVDKPIGTHLRDPLTVAYASYLAELSSEFSLEDDRNPALFELLDEGLDALSMADSVGKLRRIARRFEVRLISLAGYGPRLSRCVVCDDDVATEEASIGVSLGGVLCAAHSRRDRTLVVGRETLDAATRFESEPLRSLSGVELSRRAIVELRRLYGMLLSERLDRRPRCADYVESLERNVDDATPTAR